MTITTTNCKMIEALSELFNDIKGTIEIDGVKYFVKGGHAKPDHGMFQLERY